LKVRQRRGLSKARTLTLLMIGVAGASCLDHADLIVEPQPGGLLDRYVSLGNSITASFQSEGIHLEMQNQAYPVLLARKAGAPFGVPELAYPGCPPPLVAPLSRERIGAGICAFRVQPGPPLVQNLAVPGATVAHALSRQGTGSGLDLIILGARSQVEAMLAARPTLVSVWLGNNDALQAALKGDPALLTPIAEFRAAYDQVVAAVRQTPAQDAILIGVADAARMAPALQPGAYFWALAGRPDPPLALQVSDNCAPFTPTGEPNPAALRRLVSFQAVVDHLDEGRAGPVVIDCAADAPFLLNEVEQQQIAQRVEEFNAHIRQRAQENGWVYVDPGASFVTPALADPDGMRKCQHLTGGQDEAAFLAAVESSCPAMDAPNFFGALFSFDGVHPSSAAHAIIADTLAARLNVRHGLTLPVGN
jgi:lysophospholipase L1-like esterase